MENKNDNITFEDALSKLSDAVNKLQNGNIKLDEAFSLFEDGIKYAKICENKLQDVENKVAKIVENGKIEDFNIGE